MREFDATRAKRSLRRWAIRASLSFSLLLTLLLWPLVVGRGLAGGVGCFVFIWLVSTFVIHVSQAPTVRLLLECIHKWGTERPARVTSKASVLHALSLGWPVIRVEVLDAERGEAEHVTCFCLRDQQRALRKGAVLQVLDARYASGRRGFWAKRSMGVCVPLWTDTERPDSSATAPAGAVSGEPQAADDETLRLSAAQRLCGQECLTARPSEGRMRCRFGAIPGKWQSGQNIKFGKYVYVAADSCGLGASSPGSQQWD